MKRIMLVICVVLVVFLPLAVNATDGNGRSRRQVVVDCNSKKLSKKAKRACKAKAVRAAIVARRRLEEARRRAILAETLLKKTASENISKDNSVGEDLSIRKIVIDAIGDNAATAIVMETQTGKILTAVNQDWAYRKAFPPCSTIKLITTVAGLNEDIIDEDDETSQEDLQNALARSQNSYFQKVGSDIGYPKLIATAKEFGLGEPTGINTSGESAGKLPQLVKKTSLVYSHGYGFEISPLQQAVMVSAITNHGKKVTPFIMPKSGIDPVTKIHIEQVNLPVEDLDGVIPGMKGATEYGTAHLGVDFRQGVAGKTGTCSATGTFTSVAPIDSPKYTVVVVIRGRFGKGRYASAIAGKIYQALLGPPTPATSAQDTTKPEPTPLANNQH